MGDRACDRRSPRRRRGRGLSPSSLRRRRDPSRAAREHQSTGSPSDLANMGPMVFTQSKPFGMKMRWTWRPSGRSLFSHILTPASTPRLQRLCNVPSRRLACPFRREGEPLVARKKRSASDQPRRRDSFHEEAVTARAADFLGRRAAFGRARLADDGHGSGNFICLRPETARNARRRADRVGRPTRAGRVVEELGRPGARISFGAR